MNTELLEVAFIRVHASTSMLSLNYAYAGAILRGSNKQTRKNNNDLLDLTWHHFLVWLYDSVIPNHSIWLFFEVALGEVLLSDKAYVRVYLHKLSPRTFNIVFSTFALFFSHSILFLETIEIYAQSVRIIND